MKQKVKKIWLVMMCAAIISIVAACSSTETNQGANANNPENTQEGTNTSDFPTKNITGVIMWGAGGATDNVARGISPIVEKYLNTPVVMTNKTGATGAIATQYVFDQKADGYTLLMGAENPALYKVLDISERGFEDFYPVNIFGRGVAVIAVPEDSPWNSLEDVLQAAKENPGKIKMGSTGTGGIVHVVASMLAAEKDVEFNMVPFDGEGPALTAMLGNHVDITIPGLVAAAEYAKAGKIKVLAVVNDTKIDELPDAPALGELYPGFNKYLPWGPFYGVWIKKETPDEIKNTLVSAFDQAFQDASFQDILKQLGAVPMGISGDEADEFLQKWQSVTAWILHDSGEAAVSPEELGIPRVQD